MTILDKLVSVINSKHVYIQTHNFPDPDAISSAFGLQKLLLARNISSTICYRGKIDRNNIKKMLELFNIEVSNVDDIENLTETDEVILIDAQKGNGNTDDIIGDEIGCIDHHPYNNNSTYKFKDIRKNVGACASIIASYFIENNISMEKNVAEALLYGIKIDTADMTRGVSKLDLDMFYELFQYSDRKKINTLESEVLSLEDLKAFGSAIESIFISDNVSFANTGNNCPEALIATVADFMLEIVNINVAMVYSIKETGIKFSVRCTKNSGINAGKLIIEALNDIGTGGGHSVMAGGFVPYNERICKDMTQDIVNTVKDKFLELVKVSKNVKNKI